MKKTIWNLKKPMRYEIETKETLPNRGHELGI